MVKITEGGRPLIELHTFPAAQELFELRFEWLEAIEENQKFFRKRNELASSIRSLLVKAAAENHLHIFAELTNKHSIGVNAARSSKEGITALHAACRSGHCEMAKFLLALGANLAAEDDKGRRAIHYAVKG